LLSWTTMAGRDIFIRNRHSTNSLSIGTFRCLHCRLARD